MKNKLLLTLGVLSFLSTFQLSAELIPITIGSNNTLKIATFIYDTGKTTSIVSGATPFAIPDSVESDVSGTKNVINNPDFSWYTFKTTVGTTVYIGGNKITRIINPGTSHAFTVNPYEHLFIDQTNDGSSAVATLRTVNAPQGKFKILGQDPMTGKINENAGFIVTVE